jgi:glycine/D-amino acid oxidase-like deaminating enzyme
MLALLLLLILQRKDGRVLLGETRPEEASNTDGSSANAHRILALAAAAVPALATAQIEGAPVFNRLSLCLKSSACLHVVSGWLFQ